MGIFAKLRSKFQGGSVAVHCKRPFVPTSVSSIASRARMPTAYTRAGQSEPNIPKSANQDAWALVTPKANCTHTVARHAWIGKPPRNIVQKAAFFPDTFSRLINRSLAVVPFWFGGNRDTLKEALGPFSGGCAWWRTDWASSHMTVAPKVLQFDLWCRLYTYK